MLDDYSVADNYTSGNDNGNLPILTRSATGQNLWVAYLVMVTFISSMGFMPLPTTGIWLKFGKNLLKNIALFVARRKSRCFK